MSRNITLKKAYAFISLQATVIPAELKLKGKVAWKTKKHINGKIADYKLLPPHNHNEDDIRSVYTHFYSCPSCTTKEPDTCRAFQHHDLDNTHRCISCKRTSKVNLWNCECNTKWHLCCIHRNKSLKQLSNKTEAASSEQPPDSTPLTTGAAIKRKRAMYSSDFETLAAEDKERADKLAKGASNKDINLGWSQHTGININLLGPTLKRRFVDISHTDVTSTVSHVSASRRCS